MLKRILFVLGLLVMLGLIPVNVVVGYPDVPHVVKSPTHAPDYRPGEAPFLPMETLRSDSQLTPQAVTILPWSKVVFQSYRHGNWEIYASNDDGSGMMRLTSLASTDIYPRFNRGATRVAFASNRTGNYDLFVMNADGSAVRQLTSHPANDYNPAWSPDGSKIAFSSYRDGQSEIYVMNADGSNQTRLTFDPAYDGAPAWSPDGSKIAFNSNRSGVSAVWVMNADGTAPTLLSYQPYAQNPVWSPDGSQIAYDADGDNDGWQELWLMNADGSSQRQIYKSYDSQTDVWMRSWSPDGRYIAFTRIKFVYYQGNWYWMYAYLEAVDTIYGFVHRLNSGDVKWYPDWQTTDSAPPISHLAPLPAQSPSPIQLRWSGADVGPAGLRSYDVQVKEGVGGVWTDVAKGTANTSAAYAGVGGRTYYFRLRARDIAYNVEPWPEDYDAVTMVEAMPPVSRIDPFPAYSPFWENLVVRWSGYDPGDSGIKAYDIQYRDGNNEWTNWLTQIDSTRRLWEIFYGEPGHTYSFRSRAIDHAQNMEEWPADDSTTTTTLYTLAITGTVRDNTYTPVADAIVTTMPQPIGVIPSDNQGVYRAYLGDEDEFHALTITKTGYGDLPSTDIEGLYTEIEFDVILPPSNNAIRNGDFETLPITTAWAISGTQLTAPIDFVAGHTGKYALRLGQAETAATNVSYPGMARALQSVVDSNGIMHVIWVEDDIFYAQRSPDGHWSTPYNVTNEPGGYFDKSMVVDNEGVVHLVWLDGDWADNLSRLFYAYRQTNGHWSTPRFLTDSYYSNLKTAVTPNGTLHIAWLAYHDFMDVRLSHTWRNSDSIWYPIQEIATMNGDSGNLQLAVDNMNNAHIAWYQYVEMGICSVFYTYQESNGDWQAPQVVKYNSGGPLVLSVDNLGTPHILLFADSPAGLYHTYQESDGSWSLPQHISGQSYMVVGHQALFDKTGNLHVVWTSWQHNDSSGNHVFHAYRGSDNIWTSPQSLFNVWGSITDLRIAALPTGGIQVVWASDGIYYARQDADGMWSIPQNVASGNEPQIAITTDALTHLLWRQDWVLFHKVICNDEAHYAALKQTVTVTEYAPILSFLYQFYGASPNGGLTVSLDDDAATTHLLSIIDEAHRWTHAWIDLTPWAGQTVTLSFDLPQEPYYPAPRAYLDEISLGSTYPDVWVQTTNLNVRPGDTAVYEIFYGNRGGAPAENVRILATLPEELTFVDATPKPVTETAFLPAWVWNLGTLSAKSEPFAIVLTATVALTTPTSSPLMSTFRITSTTPELELANNTIVALTVVDYKVYLPLVLRKH